MRVLKYYMNIVILAGWHAAAATLVRGFANKTTIVIIPPLRTQT